MHADNAESRATALVTALGALGIAAQESSFIDVTVSHSGTGRLLALLRCLEEVEEFLDDRADCDQPSGEQPVPNAEMRLLVTVRHALGRRP